MSTRAAIGFRVGDEIHTIYSHYDGYPSHVGKVLQTYFRSSALAEDLVYHPGGQIRNFDSDGTVARYNEGSHDISDTPCEAIHGYDYLYLFDDEKQEWACFSRHHDLPSPALKRIEIPA
jgi:hypothetical protein